MNKLQKYFKEQEAIKEAYEAADMADNEEGRKEARENIKVWDEKISKEGKYFGRIYCMYETSKERGNELIDIDEIIWDKDFDELMDELHHNGITRFTFSSTWSSAIQTAWQFKEAGWNLTGMTQINGRCKKFMSSEYEKIPALVFEY